MNSLFTRFLETLQHAAQGMRRFPFVAFALLLPALLGGYVGAFLLRFDGQPAPEMVRVLLGSLPWVVVTKLTVAAWFHLYSGWNRFFTFHDLTAIAKTVSCATIGIILLDALVVPELTIPRSIVLLDWGVSLFIVAGLRATPRLWRNFQLRRQTTAEDVPVLIVGADDSGENLLRSVQQNPNIKYRVVGFVDDRPALRGRRIAGVEVLGGTGDIESLTRLHRIEEVLIHSGELPGKVVRQILESARENNFRVNVLPSFEQLLSGSVSIQPRPVAIEDLLRRESVVLDSPRLREWVAGQTVLVTGSAGSIGSEICRQILALEPHRLVVLDRSETGQFFLERELRRLAPAATLDVVLADLNDAERLAAVFEQFRPDILFHAAAYKHVPLMELHPGEAVKNIALATRNLVDLAHDFEVSAFVMISTDKAVNPTSVMGSCKQLAERYVQAKALESATRFVTVRFGNVLDSAGSVVPIFREQIARGGPVTVTNPDIIRYFMLIPEAAQLVIEAGAMGQGGEIFVLDMGQPVKIVDLARDMIRLSGLRENEDIEIEFTGLRPGEKLFEELYGENEVHRQTSHPKIMVAASQTWDLLRVVYDLNHLEAMANRPADQVRTALGEVVPLYVPGKANRRAA